MKNSLTKRPGYIDHMKTPKPDLTAQIFFVPYGYQLDVTMPGVEQAFSVCRDFGGTYPIRKLVIAGAAVITDAIQRMERRALSKPKAFFFHYNKPASLKAGKPILSVHADGACHLVEAVDCRVACATKIRTTQPRCVMAGRGHVTVEHGKAVIQ